MPLLFSYLFLLPPGQQTKKAKAELLKHSITSHKDLTTKELPNQFTQTHDVLPIPSGLQAGKTTWQLGSGLEQRGWPGHDFRKVETHRNEALGV